MTGPLGLTAAVGDRTGTPSDIRTGTVSAVTPRGIDVAVADGLIQGAAHLNSYNPAVGDTVAMISYSNSWMILGRAVGPGTATDSATPGTGLGYTLLDAMVLTKSGSVLATSTGTAVTVPRYGVTLFHPPGHWLEIRPTYTWFSTTNGDVMQVQLWESLSNAQVEAEEHIQPVGASQFTTTTFVVPPSLGGGRRSYFLKIQRVSGAGNCRLEDHALRRGSMLAFDLGDQAIIRTV